MKVGIIGAGYVGEATGRLMYSFDNEINFYDVVKKNLGHEFNFFTDLEDLVKKRVMKYLILFKTKGKDIKFEALWKPLMELNEQTIYALYDEIIDGFKGGEPDLI